MTSEKAQANIIYVIELEDCCIVKVHKSFAKINCIIKEETIQRKYNICTVTNMPGKQKDSLRITCGWKDCRKESNGMALFVRHVETHLPGTELPSQCPWTGCDGTIVDLRSFQDHIYAHIFHTKLMTIGSEWLKEKNFDPCGQSPVSFTDDI